MAYDQSMDYQALINDAAAKGDYASAAKYEQQRNEKIAASGDTSHRQTNNYSAFLGSTANGGQGSAGLSQLPSGAMQTNYIDANGNRKSGYVLNSGQQNLYSGALSSGQGAAGGNTDYQALINAAAAQGNYNAAAQYEQLRNQKIAASGDANHRQTNLYSAFLSDSGSMPGLDTGLDYQALINAAAAQGNYNAAAQYEQLRNVKISSLGLDKPQSNYYSSLLARQTAQQQQQETMQMLEAQLAETEALRQRALEANNADYAAQLEQSRLQIQQRIDALNRNYEDLNRQLYIDYMNSRKNLPQALTAQGYTGGLTESSLLGLDTGYAAQLAANERERLTGVNDLELGGLNSALELQIAQARAAQQLEQDSYDNRLALYTQMLNQRNLDRQFDYDRSMDEQDRFDAAQERSYARALQEQEAARQDALNTASLYGDTGLYSGLLNQWYGYTPAAPAAVVRGSGGRRKSSGSSSTGTAAENAAGGSGGYTNKTFTLGDNSKGLLVDGTRYTPSALEKNLSSGKLVAVQNSDGTYTVKKAG